MITRVALLRGVNVGGHGKLAMKDLLALLELLGLEGARTYVQSGNAAFRAPGRVSPEALSTRIRGALRDRLGVDARVLVLGLDRLEAVIRSNPFPEAEGEPTSLHVHFLTAPAKKPDLAGLGHLRRDSERFVLGAHALYLYAPEGIARSKLAARAEALVGVAMTARNWRSATRVLELAREVAAGAAVRPRRR